MQFNNKKVSYTPRRVVHMTMRHVCKTFQGDELGRAKQISKHSITSKGE